MEEKAFVPHVPEHPLPKEIQNMKHDDTVCQFCGVSYLIHSEMKALEERVKKAEETMQYYKGSVEREEKLKVAVKSLESEIAKLSSALQASEEMTTIFTSDIQTKKEQLQRLQERNTELQTKTKVLTVTNSELKQRVCQFEELLPAVAREMQSQRAELNQITAKLKGKYKELLDIIQLVVKEISASCQHYTDKFEGMKKQFEKTSEERDSLCTKYEELQDVLAMTRQDLKNLEVTKVEVNDLQSQCSQLESEMSKLKCEHNTALEHNQKLCRELAECKDVISAKSKEVEDCNKKLSKQEESSKHEKQELQSVITKRDAEINSLKQAKSDLEKHLADATKSESAVKIAASCSLNETKGLKESLSRAREEVNALKEEREKMIKAHHIRIEQLRESFKKKIEEVDVWPVKLEAMLKQQEEKLKKEKDDLWKELSESFQKEMEDEQMRHAKELQSWKTEAKAAQNKFRDDIGALTRKHREQVGLLEKSVAEEKAKAEQVKQSDSAVVRGLQQKILDLESRLEGASGHSNEDVTQLTRRLRSAEHEAYESKSHAKTLEERLNSSRQELVLLQETVRQECEERFELTEALCDARTQLLAAQRAGELSRSISGSSLNSSSSRSSKIGFTFGDVTNGPSSAVCAVGFDGGVSARPRHSSRGSPGSHSRIGSNSVDENRKRIAAAMGRSGAKSRNSSSFNS